MTTTRLPKFGEQTEPCLVRVRGAIKGELTRMTGVVLCFDPEKYADANLIRDVGRLRCDFVTRPPLRCAYRVCESRR